MNAPSPPGSATRGRTRPLRLRALDSYLIAQELHLLTRGDGDWSGAPIIDFGLGDTPATTLELAGVLRAINPDLELLGVDHAPARVAAARSFEDPRVRFALGDFDTLPSLARRARVIRVMNVLRGYPVEAVPRAHAQLGAALLDGGLALEGSSDPDGAVLTAHLLRRRGDALVREALLFHTDFSRGFAPWMFRDWLPRDLRRSVRDGTAIHAFLSAWTVHFEAHRTGEPAGTFVRSAHALRASGVAVRDDAALLASGTLVWSPGGGVPHG